MIGYYDTSNALTLLILLIGASFVHLSSPSLINTPGDVKSLHSNGPPGETMSGDGKRRDEDRHSIQKEETQEEDDLFKDVDPKTLAAVLLEALNCSQSERRREGVEQYRIEEGRRAERGEAKKEEEYKDVRTLEGADRNRDGQQELERLIATQGKEQEKEENEEIKKVQIQEDMMTEKVTSHITSQTVQVQTEEQPVSTDERRENGKGAAPQQGPSSRGQSSNEVEEQLNPEELKSLETMMKEFPSLNTATKRDRDSKQNQNESSSYNEIIPINEGSNLAMSKKKLKWQEETQKALNLPTFKGGNVMDDMEDSNYGGYAAHFQPPAEHMEVENIEPEEGEEEEEEVLSPEEEEARAKAEQEEMRRQAAEVQRAKMEEEKLADIASDMLLQYMVKQNNGKKKYSSSLSSAAEDKRSHEEQEVTEDDIDPQTIDKLIEISSKLHLPADDVVDIISDVEKKKKKDVPLEMTSHRQKPIASKSAILSSTNGFPTLPISNNKNNYPVSKQPSPAVSLLKTWFQEKMPTKSQDHWGKTAKPLLGDPNLWPKPQKPLSIKQECWLKLPKSVRTRYPSYPYTYLSYYQPYPDNYPNFPPTPRPKPYYYTHKPSLNLKNVLRNTIDETYTFTPKHRYRSWVQPWFPKPPSVLQQKPYYTSYPLSPYPWAFQPASISKQHSFPQIPVMSFQKKFYYSAPAPAVMRNKDYYVSGKQTNEGLKTYMQRILMKKA